MRLLTGKNHNKFIFAVWLLIYMLGFFFPARSENFTAFKLNRKVRDSLPGENDPNISLSGKKAKKGKFLQEKFPGNKVNCKQYPLGIYRYQQVILEGTALNAYQNKVLHFTTEVVDGQWYGAVTTKDPKGTWGWNIELIKSRDGLDWKHLGTLYEPGINRLSKWGNDGLHRPSLEYQDGTFWMSFTGCNDPGGGCEDHKSIGLVYNDGNFGNFDAWKEVPGNPVITNTPDNSDPDVGDTELMVFDQKESGYKYWMVAQQQEAKNNGKRWIWYDANNNLKDDNWELANKGKPIVKIDSSKNDIWPGKPWKGKDGNYYALFTKHKKSKGKAWGFLVQTDDLGGDWKIKNQDYHFFPNTETMDGRALEFYPVDMGHYKRIYYTDKSSQQKIRMAEYYEQALTVKNRYEESSLPWHYASQIKEKPARTYTIKALLGTNLTFQIRTSTNEEDIINASWKTLSVGDSFENKGVYQFRVEGQGTNSDFHSVVIK